MEELGLYEATVDQELSAAVKVRALVIDGGESSSVERGKRKARGYKATSRYLDMIWSHR
jgi:hypothetical protein